MSESSRHGSGQQGFPPDLSPVQQLLTTSCHDILTGWIIEAMSAHLLFFSYIELEVGKKKPVWQKQLQLTTLVFQICNLKCMDGKSLGLFVQHNQYICIELLE